MAPATAALSLSRALQTAERLYYILAEVKLTAVEEAIYRADGGTEIIRDPWDIRAGELQPLAYEYVIPRAW